VAVLVGSTICYRQAKIPQFAAAEISPGGLASVGHAEGAVQMLVDGYRTTSQSISPKRLFDLQQAMGDLQGMSRFTTRSRWRAKMRSRSWPWSGKKALPGCAAATTKRRLNSARYSSRRKRLASSIVVIPRRRNSCGSRPCQVPKFRSLRHRACGE